MTLDETLVPASLVPGYDWRNMALPSFCFQILTEKLSSEASLPESWWLGMLGNVVLRKRAEVGKSD